MALIKYTAVEFVTHPGRAYREIMDAPAEWRDIGPAYVDPAIIVGVIPDEGVTSILLSDDPVGVLKLRVRETPEQIRAKMDAANRRHRRGR